MSTPPNRSVALCDGGDYLLFVGDVAGYAHGLMPLGDDGRGALLGEFLAYVHTDQACAFPRQFLCDAAHDVGAGAGHQRRLAFEFQGTPSP